MRTIIGAALGAILFASIYGAKTSEPPNDMFSIIGIFAGVILVVIMFQELFQSVKREKKDG